VDEPNLARVEVELSGRVQGVGFRYYTIRWAQSLGINGVVRNTNDGTVQIVAEGSRTSLEKLVQAVGKGPASARVSDVKLMWGAYSGQFTRFDVGY
jgi:acylphosphatase